MTASFDPYQHWLDIPPHEQPPDHYRLLGITRFESDLSVIQLAAERRMAHVRAFQTGPRAMYTQQLLNELALAKIRLLNPATKSLYDAALADSVSITESNFTADLLPPSHEGDVPVGGLADQRGAAASRQRGNVPTRAATAAEGVAVPSVKGRRVGAQLILIGVVMGCSVGAVFWFVQHRRSQAPSNSTAAATNAGKSATVSQTGAETTAQPADDKPAETQQDSSGNLRFSGSEAKLRGSLQRQALSAGEALTGWSSDEDAAEWKFKVSRLPPRGAFRARVKYKTSNAGSGQQYNLQMDGASRKRDIRDTAGDFVDEFYLQIPRTGIHVLTMHVSGRRVDFAVESIELLFSSRSGE